MQINRWSIFSRVSVPSRELRLYSSFRKNKIKKLKKKNQFLVLTTNWFMGFCARSRWGRWAPSCVFHLLQKVKLWISNTSLEKKGLLNIMGRLCSLCLPLEGQLQNTLVMGEQRDGLLTSLVASASWLSRGQEHWRGVEILITLKRRSLLGSDQVIVSNLKWNVFLEMRI